MNGVLLMKDSFARLAGVLVAAFVAALAIAAPATAADAVRTTVPVSASDIAHFRSVWTQYGVPITTQDALISKLRNGGIWDALTTTASPVSTTVVTSGGVREAISRFADGSIKVVGQDTMPNPGQISPMADIYGCKIVSSGPSYINRSCTVHTNVVVADFAYGVTFRQVQNHYDNIVSRSTNLTFNCYSGTCSGDYVKTIRTTETASLPASVQGGLVFTCYGGTCSRSYFLVFELRNDKYTAWNN